MGRLLESRASRRRVSRLAVGPVAHRQPGVPHPRARLPLPWRQTAAARRATRRAHSAVRHQGGATGAQSQKSPRSDSAVGMSHIFKFTTTFSTTATQNADVSVKFKQHGKNQKVQGEKALFKYFVVRLFFKQNIERIIMFALKAEKPDLRVRRGLFPEDYIAYLWFT